jgi:hypothetical protein
MAWAIADAIRSHGGPLAAFVSPELPAIDLAHLPTPEDVAKLGLPG